MRYLSFQITGIAAIMLLLCAGGVQGQMFTDGGLGCGSGIVFMPTCSAAPPAEFRIQANHLLAPGSAMRNGYTVADLTGGLSPNLECFIRLGLVDPSSEQPNTPYAFGAKFLLPFEVPFFSKVAVWTETATNVQGRFATYSFADGARYALLFERNADLIVPGAMLGLTNIGGRIRPMIAAAGRAHFGNALQVGVEALYGYQGGSDIGAFATATYQLLGHVGIKASAGEARMDGRSQSLFSLGLQLTSGMLGFEPGTVAHTDELVPSFDEINKQVNEDNTGGKKDDAALRPSDEGKDGAQDNKKDTPQDSKKDTQQDSKKATPQENQKDSK